MNELVTAVMVTGKDPGRQVMAQAAIKAFQLQTWDNKELLIVNDGPVPTLGEGVKLPNIREVMVKNRRSLGELRNIGLTMANGDWITQWDDDDWYHPERIESMMFRREGKKAVTLNWQIRHSFTKNSSFYLDYSRIGLLGIPGTILHPKTKVRYRPLGKHEDAKFVDDAFNNEVVVIDNNPTATYGPWLYIRFYHGLNTWDERHIMGRTGTNWTNLSSADYSNLQDVIKRYYQPNAQEPDTARNRSLTGSSLGAE